MAAKTKKRRIWAAVLFIIYLLALIYFLFFAENMGRTAGTGYRYNLELFKEIKRFIYNIDTLGVKAVALNVLGNVVVFIPFGYFLPQIFKTKIGVIVTTLMTLMFSVLVELLQLVTMKGSFDIDDILLNTIGGFIGYIIYWLIHRRKR